MGTNNGEIQDGPIVQGESFSLPFLGSRLEDHQSFQYMLLDLNNQEASIALPKWAIARARLNRNDIVRLHAPFRTQGRNYDQGPVTTERWDQDMGSQVCAISLLESPASFYPVYVDLDKGETVVSEQKSRDQHALLARIFKDTYLLKRGISIYLEHLIPFFSRVSGVSRQEFAVLREMLLEEVREHVNQNKETLQKIWINFDRAAQYDDDILGSLDLENFRETVESELNVELFSLPFESPIVAQQILAIKNMEQRLYFNYNTVVILYLRSLSL